MWEITNSNMNIRSNINNAFILGTKQIENTLNCDEIDHLVNQHEQLYLLSLAGLKEIDNKVLIEQYQETFAEWLAIVKICTEKDPNQTVSFKVELYTVSEFLQMTLNSCSHHWEQISRQL